MVFVNKDLGRISCISKLSNVRKSVGIVIIRGQLMMGRSRNYTTRPLMTNISSGLPLFREIRKWISRY